VVSGSSERDNYYSDSESTYGVWIEISDLRREQVGIDYDDDIDSGSKPVS